MHFILYVLVVHMLPIYPFILLRHISNVHLISFLITEKHFDSCIVVVITLIVLGDISDDYHPRESFTAGQRKIETLKVAPFFILNTKINVPWYPVVCVKIWKEFPEPPVTMGIGASSPLTLKMMLVDPACRGKTFS